MRARLRALPAGWRVALVCLSVVVALNVIAAIGNRIAPEPTGPPFSSYSTTREGTAAFGELLEREGHSVERLRGDLADAEPDPDATVFVIGAGRLSSDEAETLEDFLARGGRLVAGGPNPHWIDTAVGGTPEWSGDGSESLRPLVPSHGSSPGLMLPC